MCKTVSLAMTTYNGEKYIREQLDSIYNQTMVPNEVIVCDDNSKDRTVEILEEYHKKKDLKYYVNKPGLGVNMNFYSAISKCSGDYIVISDQDDIWLPGKIQILYDSMLETEKKNGKGMPILISSDSARFSDTSKVCLKDKTNNDTITGYRNFIFNSNLHCQGCTTMMNRALIKELPVFPSDFKEFPYDVFFTMIATLTGERCHICQPLMYYRNHENNIIGKLRRLSFLERFKNKMGWLTYSLLGIPYSRQKHYSELIEDYRINISNSEKYEIVLFIRDYFNSSIFGKIILLINTRSIGFKSKLFQLIVFLLTTPLRLFIKP